MTDAEGRGLEDFTADTQHGAVRWRTCKTSQGPRLALELLFEGLPRNIMADSERGQRDLQCTSVEA